MLHDRLLAFLLELTGGRRDLRLLDTGAHRGSLTRRLRDSGFRVTACDRFPEVFACEGVRCDRADLNEQLPYDTNAFDVVIGVEVMEHLTDHETFLRECARVTRPGGLVIVTMPNIVSLRSRLRFLLTGFFYSFEPLDARRDDGMQHVSPIVADQCRHLAERSGLRFIARTIDRRQNTSRWLMWLYPAIRIAVRWCGHDAAVHNDLDLLLGRRVLMAFRKDRTSATPGA